MDLQISGGVCDEGRHDENVRVALEHLLGRVDEVEGHVVIVGYLDHGDLGLANPNKGLVAKLGARCDVVGLTVVDLICCDGLFAKREICHIENICYLGLQAHVYNKTR